ncbi:hypothetical protein KAF25_005600 [Fusarium avenaceum]|uniref:Catalase core domain-containing protein n=1 Tax=Fusarium avenaceum TaxID=40199 RepID=A0A9P7H478_9HYPO|nr:hypothetical protein KAF25_005600 [Fusarium avenaceum]
MIVKVSGAQAGGKMEDDGLYCTNNEDHPFPDPNGLCLCSDALRYLEWTKEVTELTKSNYLFTVGEKTPTFFVFSTPIIFCRNPIQVPDGIRSQSRNPANFLLDHDALFNLLSNTPKANPPDLCSSVIMERPKDGASTADPDKLGFDPFDVTKVWTRSQFPMKEFGRLVLNKNAENFHRDVEQAAFSPGSMVPGIEDPPNPLLQFRMFFYCGSQYHHIGVNLHHIPVNYPFMANSYASLSFNGPMRAPYQVNDNVVSSLSRHWHEGKKDDYDQANGSWTRTMSEQENNTYYDISKGFRRVKSPEIQQVCFADQPQFDFSKVKKLADCIRVCKEPKFRPDSKLTGYPLTGPVYQA